MSAQLKCTKIPERNGKGERTNEQQLYSFTRLHCYIDMPEYGDKRRL